MRTLAVVATCTALAAACSSGKSAANTAKQAAADEVLIRHLYDDINRGYQTSVRAGHTAEAASNYDSSTPAAQAAFRKCLDRTSAGISYNYAVNTVSPDPGWVDEDGKTVPPGRIYAVTVAVTLTDVPTGTKQAATTKLHATILPDGTAREFIKCG